MCESFKSILIITHWHCTARTHLQVAHNSSDSSTLPHSLFEINNIIFLYLSTYEADS